MTNYEKWKEERLKDPEIRKEYDKLAPYYDKKRKELKQKANEQ